VDVVVFDGDTLRGKGFQTITTPFGRHAWEPDADECDIEGRRWVSSATPYADPEEALEYCRSLLPDRYSRYVRIAYHPSDSLTIWPWELRKSGEGWLVLRKHKPIDPRKQEVDTPWGHMRWDKGRKIWLCDKKVVPNDFR
jgi:hypothetical protein